MFSVVRLGFPAMAAVLLSLSYVVAPAQQRQYAQDDYLLRLFNRTDGRYRRARRNLEVILRNQPEFWQELRAVAARLETEQAWLLNVIAVESLFDPDARNPLPGQTASGLLQIIEDTARRLGTNTDAIRRMGPVAQLRLVERYLEPFKGRLRSLADVYMAVFRGSILEGGAEVVVVDSSKEPRIYGLNKLLDLDKNGRITKGELELAALSVGRFAPARPSQQRDKNTSSGRPAFAPGKGKTPRASGEGSVPAAMVTLEHSVQSPRSTRSIYIRRENAPEDAVERRK